MLSGASAFGAVATIAVASNFAEVAKHLASEFESNSGHRLTIVTGASGRFYAQILNGAPFDVFLSADSEKPSQLISSGYGQPDSAFTYATGRLVLWSRDESLIKDDASVLSSIDSTKSLMQIRDLPPMEKLRLRSWKPCRYLNLSKEIWFRVRISRKSISLSSLEMLN